MNKAKLTTIRRQLGLSPVQMAHAMGTSYATYKDWQSGRRNMSGAASRCLELLQEMHLLGCDDLILDLAASTKAIKN